MSTSVYDRASKTLTRTSPTGRKTQVTFDSKGNPLQMTAAGMPTRTWAYDDRARVKTITTTASSGKIRVQSYDYDADGWVKHFTDPLSEVTEYKRDEVGRVTTMTAFDGTSTEWVLDNADNVTRLTPASTENFLFEYDVPSKLLSKTRPPVVASTSITAPSADATGTRPTIGGVAFDYNLLANQLKAIRRSDGRSIGFSYDALGRLSEQKLGNASIQYSYTNGHPTRINRTDSVTLDQTFDGPLWTSSAWTGAVKGNVKATYDKNLALSSLTVNDQSTVSFAYDADGLLTAATATVGGVTFARDALSGNLTGVSVGNTTGTVTYGEFGELASLGTTIAGAGSTAGTLLFQQNIVERDALGRIKHLTETVQGVSHDVSYEYDKAGRLAKQTRDGIVTTFTFDANGNRTAVQEGTAAPIVATYDAQDRILTRGSSVFNHGDHGDLELRTGGATSLALSYDELGNLLRAVSSDGATQTTIEYKVDGLGRRVARMVGGKFDKTWLYRDSLRPVAEIAADGTFTHFVYASNNPLSGAPVALIRGGTLYRVVTDHIGSVRLVVNAQTGAVAQSIDYDANGRVLNETGTGFQPFGFAGGLYDAMTGLVRFGARDYDPELGRWTNRDPIGFAGQQGNVYLYVGGEPINGLDADGEHPVALAIAAGLGVLLATSDREAYAASIGAVLGAFMGPMLGRLGTASPPVGRELVHLTGAGNEIVRSGLLLGRGGIYATTRETAGKAGASLAIRTGLTAAKATSAIPIPAAARGAFSRPLPIGVVTGWQSLMGTQCTAAGYVDLATGAFVRTGVNWNQVLLYGIDVGIDGSVAWEASYALD